MCLLTFYPKGVQVDGNALFRGAATNDDGHGFAIVIPASDKILVRKGMDAAQMIEQFEIARDRYPDGPAIFHSRWATDGVKGKFNVHPFIVGGDKRTVMGHNGIFPDEARPSKSDIRSDTRIVADDWSRFFDLTSLRGRQIFGRWMGTGNKVAILTVDPRYKLNGYIINEKSGTWHDGVWYSNDAFKPYTPPKTTTGTYRYTWERGDYTHCALCKAYYTVNPIVGYCTACRSCQDCMQSEDDCWCFVPASAKKDVEAETTDTGAKALERLQDGSWTFVPRTGWVQNGDAKGTLLEGHEESHDLGYPAERPSLGKVLADLEGPTTE